MMPRSATVGADRGASKDSRYSIVEAACIAEGASYLHLVVNWCEIDVAARFFAHDQVVSRVRELPFYRWIYQTVIEEWRALAALYADCGLVPIRAATSMSDAELRLAARADEARA